MLSKSLIQFSVDGWGCVPSLLFDLRPIYGEGNEDNGPPSKGPMQTLLHTVPQPYSRPPPTHTSTRDSWTHTGTSESVSYGVTAPFFWVLVCTRFFLCPPRVCFPVLCKFLRLYSEVNGDLLQEGYPYPGLLHPEPLPLQQATADPYLCRRHSNTVLVQSLWGLWVLYISVIYLIYNLPCLTRMQVSGGQGFVVCCCISRAKNDNGAQQMLRYLLNE